MITRRAGIYSVQDDFGIGPSATADQTGALIAAIAKVRELPGPGGSDTILDFGAGVYLIGAPLLAVDGASYLRTVRGEGSRFATRLVKHFDGDLFSAHAGSIHLVGLTVDMQGATHRGRFAVVTNGRGSTPHCEFRQLRITDASDPGIEVGPDAGSQMKAHDVYFGAVTADATVPLFRQTGVDSMGIPRELSSCQAAATRLFDAPGVLGLWVSDCEGRGFLTSPQSRTIMMVNNRFAIDRPGSGPTALTVEGNNIQILGGAISSSFVLGRSLRNSIIGPVMIDGDIIRHEDEGFTNQIAGFQNYRRVSANVQVLPTDDVIDCDASAGAFGIDFPPPERARGKPYLVSNVGTAHDVELGWHRNWTENLHLAPGQSIVARVRNGEWTRSVG